MTKKKDKPKSEVEALPDAASAKAPDDGQAQTAAEPVPEPGKKKRGRPPGSKTKKPGADGKAEDPFMDPEFVKMAALGPLILAGGIGAKFFDVILPYDPEKVAGCQRTFVAWMDEMQLRIGPGWQYGILTCVCIGQGIMDAERISPEQKAAAQKAQEEQKAARKAAREQAAKPEQKPAQTNGAASAQLGLVPQKPANADSTAEA